MQGAGGGIAAACAQTAAQGVMPHQDLAAVTAVYLLFSEIGGAVGTAIAGGVSLVLDCSHSGSNILADLAQQ